ncbi:uncharacterized protein E0L32_005548 [Thyridium curvatum]|uniref:Vesicular-fusion protein SEC18 n=1 Tax=Thyridium curvatum TaxID=1093900 RepID=A0A507AWL0_9PEZI|nr:uncharacterized protein E0L32_005548 [Thyridium curvatum]TPX14352.1 hypothetical protein E0L32_005548 [Thyridium curvatum]
MDMRNNLFGKGPRGGVGSGGPPPPPRPNPNAPPPGSYNAPPPGSYNMPPPGSYNMPPSYNSSPGISSPRRPVGGGNAPPPSQMQYRPSAPGGQQVMLRLTKIDDKNTLDEYIYGNLCAVSPNDFPPNRDGSDLYLMLRGPEMSGSYVVTARPLPGFPDGTIYLSDPQRTWCGVGLRDTIMGEYYDPFKQGNQAYLGSMDLEIGFASTRKTTEEQYDQDVLEQLFLQRYADQVLAPGQRILMDIKNIPLSILVRTVNLVDLSVEKKSSKESNSSPNARGILVKGQTKLTFFKDAKSPINLKASSRRPPANAIISPDFDFRSLGIGGLDDEFATIFRRAFASRVFPPGLIEKLGVMHCKGILLFGPPGTGKTLIARKLGKLLNAREPIVVNGPELLNKYVGASEENVRKLFTEAEKEYKAKGEESGLHIIIFDELDAVCKQRGSGAGGGTGVGDSIVNQLLSKLDGVDQLNNILLIGMTNRKDMIDEALLRPGRLELQIEISLPDENGRQQILNIHTAKMVENGILDTDVDIAELAALTKNFSGAEISGLVRSATSYAFGRHTKVGTIAGVGDDVENMRVNRGDFMNALSEVRPAYGVADDELSEAIPYGIIDFSPNIKNITNDGLLYAKTVRLGERLRRMSVLIHGPPGAGKTALAAHIALKADYPFTKFVTPQSLVPFRDEMGRRDHLHKAFSDAYKSPLSILIIDSIEQLIEWNPVGPRLSNTIFQTLRTLLQAPPPKGHRLLILATTSQLSTLSQLDMLDSFDRQISVPAVGRVQELGTILSEMNVFESEQDINAALNGVNEVGSTVGVGVKNVLTIADTATEAGDSPVDWFVDQLRDQMMRNQVGQYR